MPQRPRVLAGLLTLLLLGIGAPLAGQVPDSAQDRRDRDRREERRAAPTDTAAPPPAPAAPSWLPPRLALTLAVGGGDLGTVQTQPVIIENLDPMGGSFGPFTSKPGAGAGGSPFAGSKPLTSDTARIQRSLESEGGYRVSAAATFTPGSAWAVRVEGAWSRSDLVARYHGEDSTAVESTRFLPDRRGTDLTAVGVQTSLRLWIPSSRTLQPFVELGGGALRVTARDRLPGGESLEGGVTRLSGLAGAGAIWPLSERMAVEGRGTIRTFRTPGDPAATGAPGARTMLIGTRFADPGRRYFADGSRELTTLVQLQLGVTVLLGARRPVVEEPADPDDPTRGTSGPSSPSDR